MIPPAPAAWEGPWRSHDTASRAPCSIAAGATFISSTNQVFPCRRRHPVAVFPYNRPPRNRTFSGFPLSPGGGAGEVPRIVSPDEAPLTELASSLADGSGVDWLAA